MSSSPQIRLPERLESILAISRKMNSERDLGTLLDLVVQETAALLECERASIFLLNEETNELWSKVALGSDEILRLDAGAGIVGYAVKTGALVNVSDVYRDPRFYRAIDDQSGYRTRNALAVPLHNQAGRIIGVFEALNKRIGAFLPRDEDLLEALASHAAVAIETAQLIGDLRRNQDELVAQNGQLRREVENRFAHGIICAGPRMQQVVRLIERVRDSLVNVLITGESGTGKELAAKAIHYASPRSRRPFVALNCAALPDALVESELFGIERGVATGVQPRIGYIQKADGGTLFLDEIGDLSLTAQAKILRVLQERVVERVGGRTPIPVDVRVLAATNRDLPTEIARGNFREDLFYRLNVLHLHMPPLREVREEISLLANHFLQEYANETGRSGLRFAPGVVRRLATADWPGNVRQLRNEVMRLAACATGDLIEEDEVWNAFPAPVRETVAAAQRSLPKATLKEAVEDLERRMLLEALESTRNNQFQTARSLGLSRQGLINKMKRYGITAA